MRFRNIFTGVVTLTALTISGLAAANPITYKGSDSLAGWKIAYNIETDGKVGTLALTDIITSYITFVGSATSNPADVTITGSNTFYFSNTLADGTSGVSPVSATVTGLFFNFAGAGGLDFCQDGYATCYAYTPAFARDDDSVVYHPGTKLPIKEVDGPNNHSTLQPGTYVSVASRNQAFAEAVPEPAAGAMLMAGFGMVGISLRRRPRSTVTA